MSGGGGGGGWLKSRRREARFNWYVNRVSLAFAVRTRERAYKGRTGRPLIVYACSYSLALPYIIPSLISA